MKFSQKENLKILSNAPLNYVKVNQVEQCKKDYNARWKSWKQSHFTSPHLWSFITCMSGLPVHAFICRGFEAWAVHPCPTQIWVPPPVWLCINKITSWLISLPLDKSHHTQLQWACLSLAPTPPTFPLSLEAIPSPSPLEQVVGYACH